MINVDVNKNTIPHDMFIKSGSAKIMLKPAPEGRGIVAGGAVRAVGDLAGIKDIWSKTKGQTKTKLNLIYALVDALKKLSEVKVKPVDITKLCIIEGKLKSEEIIPDSVSTKTSVQQQEAIEA